MVDEKADLASVPLCTGVQRGLEAATVYQPEPLQVSEGTIRRFLGRLRR